MAIFYLERKEDPSGNDFPLSVEVIHDGGFIEIRVDGYGEKFSDQGSVISLEHYQGKLQVHVFSDINKDDDQQTIDLEGAREDRRSEPCSSRP